MDIKTLMDALREKIKGKKYEYNSVDASSQEDIEGYAKSLDASDELQELIYKELRAKGILNKEFLDNVHNRFIKGMQLEFNKLRDKTSNKALSLDTCCDNMGEFGAHMIALNPAVGIQEFFAMYSYWQEGEKDYYVSPSLCPRLLASNIKSIPIELLQLPFRSFRILIPNDILSFSATDQPTIFLREMIVVDYFNDKDKKRRLMVLHRNRDDVGHFAIVLDEPDLQSCVEKSVKRMWENSDMVQSVRKSRHEFSKKMEEELRASFEFVVKCILYITGATADIEWVDESAELASALRRAKSGKKRSKIEGRLEKAKKGYLVGHNIVLSREEKKMYANIKAGLWTLKYRFIVQGHWRKQPFGKDRLDRKLIFIDPFYKGPELGDEINNPHILK